MTTTRQATWTNLGETVDKCKTIKGVLKKSSLDFTVEKRPLLTQGDKKSDILGVEGLSATVIKGTDRVLGVVSNKYTICQNKDAFDFVEYISDDLKFEKAGMTTTGLVYIIASLPEVKILGDSFKPHLIFQNGFNGGISLKAAISPLRIVCQNQFGMAFKEANNSISIRHTSNLQDKLVQARELMSNAANYMKVLNEKAEMYAGIKISDINMSKLFDQLFPMTEDMSVRRRLSMERKKAEFINIYNVDDNSNFKGTAWGVINAMSDYMTHYQSRSTKNSDENKFVWVTFAPVLNDLMKMIPQFS